MRNTLGTLSFGAVAMLSSMRHVWGAREDGKMKDRNGFTDDNAREPRQRLSERDMAMFLRRMANDAISHANGLGTIARMLERKRSAEHTSELQSLMRLSYAVFGLQKKKLVNQE